MSVAQNSVTLSIIGSAGRGADADKMSGEVFERAVCKATRFIKNKNIDIDNLVLVSGGSAWCDHVAVRLFLEKIHFPITSFDISCDNVKVKQFQGLVLHLPCAFLDTGRFDNSVCGRILNELHDEFNAKMNLNNDSHFDSFSDILAAIHLGAEVVVTNGFSGRNARVAESDYVLAFSWHANEAELLRSGGGTAQTYEMAKGKKRNCYHITLIAPLVKDVNAWFCKKS